MRMLALAVLLFPLSASAQVVLGGATYDASETSKKSNRKESQIDWVFELKLGSYFPALDDEFGGSETPFADIFGTDAVLMTRFSLDYEALQTRVLSLGVGLSIGRYQKTGAGLDANGEPTEDKNIFRIVPIGAEAVLRFNYLIRERQIPFVPFAKAGLDWYLWSNRKNDELTTFANGNAVQGGTFGVHGSLGLALDLNALDPEAAIGMDQNYGVNHSFLFVEGCLSKVNDFGSGESFDFSSSVVQGGLALEF